MDSRHDNAPATQTLCGSIINAPTSGRIALGVLHEELKAIHSAITALLATISPLSETSDHVDREEMANRILASIASTITNRLATRLGIEHDVVTAFTETLRPHVLRFVIAAGDIGEQHSYLFPVFAATIVALLLPQSLIPNLLGFGPLGPVADTSAAWMQSTFFRAGVTAGSWFAGLQAAGMGAAPFWVGAATKGPLVVGGMLTSVHSYFNRGE